MKDDDLEIEIDYKTITIESADIWKDTMLTSSILGPYPSYNIGVGATGSSSNYNYTTNGTGGWPNNVTISNTPGITCSGDANFEGDVKIKGVSIAKALDDINKRLAILVPDPVKLEHFAALKKAYDHYKLLEALCELPTEPKE